MDMFWLKTILLPNLVIHYFTFKTEGGGDKCEFPGFLYNSSERAWYTETLYIANSKAWDSRHKVLVKPHSFTISSEIPWICETPELYKDVQHEHNMCVKSQSEVYTKCVSSEGFNKYRVLETHLLSGKETYHCIEFLQRSENVIELKYSGPLDGDTANECSEDLMIKKEWPWIATELTLPVTCPLVGGFDFETYFNNKDKKLCPRTWRPSRLESECRLGDGLQFVFPDKGCSFFHQRNLEMVLVCWASWQDQDEYYIIASERGTFPQFALKLPSRYIGTYPRQTGYVSFSPVFKTGNNRRHSSTEMVRTIQLKLKRSATEPCFDESVACEQFAHDGKCYNEGFYFYGNYCKKSCGLCDFVPTSTAECKFPVLYQGDWILFETDHKENVNIRAGTITFSKTGKFICKGKHWNKPFYKLLSVYENGCRPKFTCLQLMFNEDDGFLRLVLSESSKQDLSFALCDSIEEPLKILYPTSRIRLLDCGLGGLIQIQGLIASEDSCRGTLSDWNPFSCSLVPTLTLSLRSCEKSLGEIHREFMCEALIYMKDDYSVLLTKETNISGFGESSYQCWIIKTASSYNTSNTEQPVTWKHAYMLTRAQCGRDSDLDPEVYQPTDTILQVYPDKISQRCIEMKKAGSGKYSVTRQHRKGSKLYNTRSHPHKSYLNEAMVNNAHLYRLVTCIILIFYISDSCTL